LKTKRFSVEKVFAENWPIFNCLKIRYLKKSDYLPFWARKMPEIAFNKNWQKIASNC